MTDPGEYGRCKVLTSLSSGFHLPYSGSYAGAGYLVTTVNTSSRIDNYVRWLDLDQALARVQWTNNNQLLTRYV